MSFRRQATFAVVLAATVAGAIGASALAAHYPGPYAGRTSQDKTMRFTISSDGRFVENAHYRNARIAGAGAASR